MSDGQAQSDAANDEPREDQPGQGSTDPRDFPDMASYAAAMGKSMQEVAEHAQRALQRLNDKLNKPTHYKSNRADRRRHRATNNVPRVR